MKKILAYLFFILLVFSLNVYAAGFDDDPADTNAGRNIQTRNQEAQNQEPIDDTGTPAKKHFTWLGIDAALGLTDVSGDYQKFLGAQIGIKVMHFHNNRFGFIFGVHYERFSFMSPDWSLFSITGESYSLSFLSFEITAAFKVSFIYIGAGLFYDFLLSAKSEKTSIMEYFNSGNLGALIDIGIMIGAAYVGLKFKFGLSNIFNYSTAQERTYGVYLTGGFGISL